MPRLALQTVGLLLVLGCRPSADTEAPKAAAPSEDTSTATSSRPTERPTTKPAAKRCPEEVAKLRKTVEAVPMEKRASLALEAFSDPRFLCGSEDPVLQGLAEVAKMASVSLREPVLATLLSADPQIRSYCPGGHEVLRSAAEGPAADRAKTILEGCPVSGWQELPSPLQKWAPMAILLARALESHLASGRISSSDHEILISTFLLASALEVEGAR